MYYKTKALLWGALLFYSTLPTSKLDWCWRHGHCANRVSLIDHETLHVLKDRDGVR